ILIAAAGAEWSAIGNDEITVGRNLQQEICLFGTDSRAGTITPDHDRDIIDTGQVRAINSVMRQGLCCMLNGVAERTRWRVALFRPGYRLVVVDGCRCLAFSGGTLGFCAALKGSAVIGEDGESTERAVIHQSLQFNGQATICNCDIFHEFVISSVVTGSKVKVEIREDVLAFNAEIEYPCTCCIVEDYRKMQQHTVGRVRHRNVVTVAAIAL